LNAKEITRYNVIENAVKGYLRAHRVAEQLYLSIRQIFRLKKALREEGIEEIIHGNKERAKNRAGGGGR